jgi:hypothetical protein
MKTDNELNRLIAEKVLNEPLEPPCGYYHETDAAQRSEDGWSGWCYNCDCSISEVAPEPRRYTADPAAWGSLFVWLAEQKRNVSMLAQQDGYHVMVPYGNRAVDPLPGRALVLATLAAYGVTEVGE